jgi:hypothetical protein
VTDLSAQPPPHKGAKEGYYPDPLGTGRSRWWDGSAWTMRVGPYAPPGAPADKPVDPPAKRCRHCGAESRTFGDRCENCGRKYGPGPGIVLAIVAASVVACILLLGGCALLLQAGIDAVEDEVDERAITKGQFDSIVPGDTESSVRIRLGKPLSEDTYARKDLECLYYAEKGEGILSIDDFEFCFRDGVLVSKHAD